MSAPSSADFYLNALASLDIRQAPTDPLTGLPLSIYYGPQHLSLPRNYQHGWHSENRLKKELPASWAEALRASIGFYIPVRFHDVTSPFGYHRSIKEGPRFPTDMDDVFTKIGLGISRTVSRYSINLTQIPGEYSLLSLNNKQHRFISNPRRTYPEMEHHRNPFRQASRDKIGRFFAEYTIIKKLEQSALSPAEEEILWDTKQPLTKELGAMVYSSSIDALNDLMPPVLEKFKEAKAEGMVSRRTDVRANILSFVPSHRFGSYYYEARDNLAREELVRTALQTGVNEVELAA